MGDYETFPNIWIAGCIFLDRLETLRRFSLHDPKVLGVPIEHMAIIRSGLVSGYPLPMSFANNLDDPRSSYCRTNRPPGGVEPACRLHAPYSGGTDYKAVTAGCGSSRILMGAVGRRRGADTARRGTRIIIARLDAIRKKMLGRCR